MIFSLIIFIMDVIYHTWMTIIIYLSCFAAACEGEPPLF